MANLKFISQTFGQNGHKLAQNRPDATFLARTLNGHNSVIFHSIFTLFFKCSLFEDKSNGDNN